MIKKINTIRRAASVEILKTKAVTIDPVRDRFALSQIVADLTDTAKACGRRYRKPGDEYFARGKYFVSEAGPNNHQVKKTCLGLAYNQIAEDVNEVVAVFVMKWGNEWMAVVNPVIEKRSEKTCPYQEGCLSLPETKPSDTVRHKTITASFYTQGTGESEFVHRTMKLKGRDAIVFQHEYDHLQGILV